MMYHGGNDDYRSRKNLIWGIALIVVGSVLLMDRMNIIESDMVWHFWPVIVGLFGLNKIISARKPMHIVKGSFLIFLAFWIYVSIEHLWGLSFRTSWPIILIACGITSIAGALIKSHKNSHQEPVV